MQFYILSASLRWDEGITMDLQLAFVWGVSGSLGIEIAEVYEILRAERLVIPAKYTRPGYWVARLCMAGMGGLLAVASGAQTRYSAMAVGTAAPALMRALPYLRNIGRGATPKATPIDKAREKKRKPHPTKGENSIETHDHRKAA
jgi:hypothetical protein